MRKEYSSVQDIFRSIMPILALLVCSLLMYFTPATNVFLLAVRIISGVIALIFMPGLYIVKTFFREDQDIRKFSFSFIIGLAFQSLVVLSLYSIGSLFLYDTIDFSLAILVVTFISTSSLVVLQTRVKRHPEGVVNRPLLGRRIKTFAMSNKFLIAAFVISLVFRLYYQSFFEAPVTDGALYLEMAKNLETTGKFTSQVIKDSWATHFFNGLGFSHHPFTIFIMAIFFSMGGASLFSAKLMTVFAGSLVVLVIYEIAKELFGKQTAMIATIIAAIHPLLLLYSCVIYGSEILGTLFVLTAFYFFLKSLRSDLSSSRRHAVFAGLLSALTLGTTNYNFWAFWVAILIPFILVLNKEKIPTRAKIAKFLAAFFLVGGVILTTFLTPDQYFIHSLSSAFWVTYSAISVALVLILFWRRNDKHIASIYWMGLVTFAIYQFVMIRTYYLGAIIPRESVTHVTTALPGVSVPLAILGIVFIQLRNLVTFSGFYGVFWEEIVGTSTQIIAFLAFLSFIRVSKWKESLHVILFPLSLSLFMTLFGFVSTRAHYWDYRLYVATVPFVIMLGASTLWLLSKAISNVEIPIRNPAVRIKGFVFASSLVIILLFSSFYSLYGEWITPMEGKYETVLYWEPAFDWIRNNTPEDAVIMARKPREFAWYTERSTVAPLGESRQGAFTIREKELIDLILQFKVGYVVVDNVFRAEYPYLKYLYDSPSDAPFGFNHVFNHEDDSGNLLIYDVTAISAPIESVSITLTDDAYTYGLNPDDNTGNLAWLYVGRGSGLHPLNVYLKFDLFLLPPDKKILKAKLRLYTKNILIDGKSTPSTSMKVFVHYVPDDNWNEQNLTYNNQPAFHPELFNASQSEKSYDIREVVTWDITELVEKEYNEDGVLSLFLEMDYLSTTSTRVEFFSTESLYKPVLDVDSTIK